jgi:putative membrane protein
MKFVVHLLIRFALTTLLVWFLATSVDQYFFVTGGWTAYLIIGALITLMNMIVRPILQLLTMPLKLLANILALIIVNFVFLWLTVWIVGAMSPELVTLDIQGGIAGWILVALILGLAKSLMKLFRI